MPPAAAGHPAADPARPAVRPPVPAPTPPRILADPISVLRRVLIVKLSSLGDIVHALPLAQSLRDGLPGAFLAWAVRARFADLLAGCPHIDAVYALEDEGSVSPVLALGRRLRAERFDAALDAQGLLVSGIVTRASGARLRLGMDRNREGNAAFLTHPIVPGRARRHMVDVLLDYCDALGLPRLPPRPQTYLAEGEAARAEELLGEHDASLVGCIIGASTPDKRWPAERWAELARLLAEGGTRVALLGGPGEAEGARVISDAARGAVALNLVGRTPLRVLASVLARCGAVVGGDSGPTHLAVGVGAPVIGLYGVTDPARSGPCWGPAPAVVLDFNEAAAPHTRRPRHAAIPDALGRIPAGAVARAAEALLRGERRR